MPLDLSEDNLIQPEHGIASSSFPNLQQEIKVSYHYPVKFTNDIFEQNNPTLRETISEIGSSVAKTKVFFVIDGGLIPHYPKLIECIQRYFQMQSCKVELISNFLILPGGEACKNSEKGLQELYYHIDKHSLCRHSILAAIGGGALLDLVGFAASTAHRGIRHLRIPTTVLSQNDSGVGVKNGINKFDKKNFIGSFAPPNAVINDFDFLESLHIRDWRSGIAEAVKVALIKDPEFFEYIESIAQALERRSMEEMQTLIFQCARHHLTHISSYGDPFEQGSSRPLDFGHWSAHKLEQLTKNRLRHGEAVAIGIALDSTYSYLTGFLDFSSWNRIIALLEKLGFSLYEKELNLNAGKTNPIFSGLTEFREHLGGQLTIMCLEQIGYGKELNEVDLTVYQSAIDYLKARYTH